MLIQRQEKKKVFPRNLVMQSLGSYDKNGCRQAYSEVIQMADNEVGQIHRYIDEDASTLPICKGPMDLLAADAISVLRSYNQKKPLLLSETGAVQPKHAGPHEIYDADVTCCLLLSFVVLPEQDFHGIGMARTSRKIIYGTIYRGLPMP